MKNRSIGMRALWMAAAVSMLSSVPAMAAGPLADQSNTSYDEETWAKLQDNVLEYDEIPLLIHEYNPYITDKREDLEKAIKDLQDNVDELRSHQKRMEDLKESAKRNGDYDEITGYAISEQTLKAIANGMDGMRQQLSGSKSTIRTRQTEEDERSDAARKMMIIYNSNRKQSQTLNQMAELYDAQYQLMVNMQAQNMATETEVYAAQINQLSAKSSLETLESNLLSLKPVLIYLTGWPVDGDPEIGEVPLLNLPELSEINLEEDTRKAIGNNETLKKQRQSAEGKTNDGVATRLAMIDEGDQKLTIEMKRLYDDIFIKKTAYEAAQTGLQAAEKTGAHYDRMYQQGSISKSQYLGGQIAVCQKKVAFESADLALRQAIDTYDAAVRGTAAVND